MSIMVAKLGSSTLVGEGGALRDDVLEARTADLVAVLRRGHRPVLVSSGAIACGYGRLGFRERPTAVPDLQAASAVGQGILFHRYLELFAAHGVTAAQVLLTSADLARRAGYVNARNTLQRLLDLGVVPVINENDTTATDELTFGDNDVLASQVAILLDARWLVLLTDRDGLYGVGADGEPEIIGTVPAGIGPDGVRLADMRGSGIGRGGIRSKVVAGTMATAAGVTCVIASGTRAEVLPSIADGEALGTTFRPSDRRESAFKLWLRHAKPVQGRVVVDAGAAVALRERGRSLLSVGVAAVDGTFVAGDAVTVLDEAGVAVGKGIVGTSADELRRSIGADGNGPSFEVIHRDQFVLEDGPR